MKKMKKDESDGKIKDNKCDQKITARMSQLK